MNRHSWPARVRACLVALSIVAAASPVWALSYRADYEASILGVVVLGRASVQGAVLNGHYTSAASLRTSGAAALFDQTNITANASGVVTPRGVGWTSYNLSHAYANKFRRVSMRRAGGVTQASATPRYWDMGAPPATAAQRNSSYDPVSALFALGRLIGQARACTGTVGVYDGRQHYRLSVTPRANGTFRGGGYNGPALLCTMRYTPISGFSDMSPAARARIPTATAWFSRPAPGGVAIPLRITVPTPIGAAQLDIRAYRYTP